MKLLKSLIVGSMLAGNVQAIECREYTDEQMAVLKAAYEYGKPYDYALSLSSIVKQESFVGKHIVRINEKDGEFGSYGVSHISLKTAMWLEGVDNVWEAKAMLVPMLILSDEYSFKLAMAKLNTVKKFGWEESIARYNGAGAAAMIYKEKIKSHIREFQACEVFD